MNSLSSKFLIVIFLFFSAFLSGQFIIENPDGDINTNPLSEDVNVCFPQGETLSFRAIASDTSSDPTVTLTLAVGREYIDATISIVEQSGDAKTIGSNIGTAEAPIFEISGGFEIGDFVEIVLEVRGTCDAINQNGVTHMVTVGEDSEGSTTHDALFLTLSLSALNVVSTSVGSSETLTGTIVGGGNGCIEDLVFVLIDDGGVTTTELRIEGNALLADSMNGDTMYYTITQAEISQVGDMDDCYEALEMLEWERDVDITSCEIDAAYQAFWGCDGERCFITDTRVHDLSLEIGIPRVEATENVGALDIWCQKSGDFTYTFTNNGTEPSPGTGSAFNIEARIGWDWPCCDGITEPRSYGNMFWCDFEIGGNSIDTMAEEFYRFKLSELPVGLDIDGPGGLEDLDGDGVFDDLAIDSSFSIDFTIKYPTCDSTCNTRIEYRRPTYKAIFDDQCETKEPISEIQLPSMFWVENPVQSDNGPTDMNDGDIATFSFFIGQLSGGFIHHDDDTTELRLMLPPGLCLAPDPNANIDGNAALIYEATQNGTMAVIKSKEGWRGTTEVDLILKCDDVVSNDMVVYWELYHLPNDGAGVCCSDFLECDSISLSAHCPLPCDGPATKNFDATRITFGYEDETETIKITEATAQELDVVFKWDTFRIEAEADVSVELDQAWVDVTYTNKSAANPFDFRSGTFEIWDNSDATLYTCPMTMPASVKSLGANDFQMRFDATHLIGTCLPTGFTFNSGDSINFEAILRFNGAGNNSSRFEFPNFRATHKGVAPMGVDTLSCDSYGTRFEAIIPTLSPTGTTNYQPSGCSDLFIDVVRDGVTKSNTTNFPGEYRPTFRIDSTVFEAPDFIEYIASTYFYRVEPGIGGTTITIPDPVIEEIGGGMLRYTFVNNGDLIRSDENNNSSCCVNQWLRSQFRPTCDMPMGNTQIVSTVYYSTNQWDLTNECVGSTTGGRTVNFMYTPPDLNTQPIIQDVVTTNTELTWEVELCNTSLNDDLPFTWFLLENPSASVLVDSVELNVFDEMGNQIDGPNLATVNTEMCSGGNDFMIELGDLAQGECVVATIFTTFSACERDTTFINAGWNCTGYPANICEVNCMLQDTLTAILLESQVQIELAQQVAPYDICTEILDTVTITSALDAFITDLLLCMAIPEGFSESDLMAAVEYPRESGLIELIPITVIQDPIRDTAYVDIMVHSGIAALNGIPGTQDANNAEEAQADIFLTWITDCDFLIGDVYEPFILANRPCGDPAIDNGVSTLSDPLTIVGVDPPFLSVIQPTVTLDTVKGCGEQEIMLSSVIIVGQSTNNDSIFITLPEGTSYTEGSYMCTIAPPGDTACPVFVGLREIAGRDQVVLSIPEGINSVTDLTFDLGFMAIPGEVCSEERIIDIDAISSVGGVFCPTTGMNCSGLQVITGTASDTIYFVKSVLGIDIIEVCTEGESYLINGELRVDSVDVVAEDSLVMEVFCDSELSDVITTIVFNGPIVAGSVLPFSEQIAASCPEGDQMYFKVDPGSGNCICTLVDTLVDINPPIEVEAGDPVSICQNKMVTLADLGASISGGATDGVWSTMGDGTFGPSDIFSEAETYTPGAADIAAGEVVLRLTSDDPDGECGPQFDDVRTDIRQVNCGTFPWDGN